MRILIAEDDFASRKLLLKFMSEYGECDVKVDGMEAIDAYLMSLEEKEPYAGHGWVAGIEKYQRY